MGPALLPDPAGTRNLGNPCPPWSGLKRFLAFLFAVKLPSMLVPHGGKPREACWAVEEEACADSCCCAPAAAAAAASFLLLMGAAPNGQSDSGATVAAAAAAGTVQQ